MGLDGEPAGRELRGGGVDRLPRPRLLGAHGQEVDLEAGEHRRAGDVIHRGEHARAVVEGDEHAVDRPEGARGDEDRRLARSDDALEVRAEMQPREIRRLAALADDDEVGLRFALRDFLEQVSVSEHHVDARRAAGLDAGFGLVHDEPRLLQQKP